MQRPNPNEYAPYYHGYISNAPEGDILTVLETQRDSTYALLKSIPEAKGDYRYAPEKWSIKELLGHIVDTERMFTYRAMAMARNDKAAFPSMDQDIYVQYGNFSQRSIKDFAEELYHSRTSGIILFRSFDDEVGLREGTASGVSFTVRSFPYIIAGHELHHIDVLKERYL